MRFVLLVVLALAAGAAVAQQMYRWTDKDGKVHYGNNPPQGVAAKAVKDASSSVAPQTPAPTSTPSSGPRKYGDDDTKPRRIDPAKQY